MCVEVLVAPPHCPSPSDVVTGLEMNTSYQPNAGYSLLRQVSLSTLPATVAENKSSFGDLVLSFKNVVGREKKLKGNFECGSHFGW